MAAILVAAGVDERHLYIDKALSARDDRPGLKACHAFPKTGEAANSAKKLST